MRVELYGGRLRGKQLRRKNSSIRQFLDVVEGRKKGRKKEKKEETHAQMKKWINALTSIEENRKEMVTEQINKEDKVLRSERVLW